MEAIPAAPTTLTQRAAGGVAAGDYDRDGHVDLYLLGPGAENLLFRNRGDGTFEDVTRAARVALDHAGASGPLFFDFDGDGWLDLFVGGTDGDAPVLFRNRQDGTFADVTRAVALDDLDNGLSAAAGDYDNDGWLDLFVSHWGSPNGFCHLWRNERGQRFDCVDRQAGLTPLLASELTDQTFTANFVDIDRDGWADLLVAADFGTSAVLHNLGDGSFEARPSDMLSDENGMGSAVGDYDADGDLDWFVTSIWDGDGVTEGDWGTSGNRLYRNRGDGRFEDVTDAAGVREGDWGWAACFADFDQDGVLDLFHVNGWPQGSKQFRGTPARLFMGQGDSRFAERALGLGLDDRGGGRGVACFDYDEDGDIDVLVANNDGSARLWRNDGGDALGHSLTVVLSGPAPNRLGVGARVSVTANGRTQLRQIRAGSNYASQDPAEAHFGLAQADTVELLEVEWPDGTRTSSTRVATDQRLVVRARAPQQGCAVANPGHR